MIVTFISKSQKKAKNKTNQILDAFANRIGDDVWQTTITQAGLQAVYGQLKAAASKSKLLCVSCHRIKSRHTTELLWIVGSRSSFDDTGKVAVNYTKRDLLHQDWQNDWHFLSALQIITTLAGLFHDIGKSSDGFQQKLAQAGTKGDPYRHEWVSLKLFNWLITGCQSDQQMFERFSQLDSTIDAPTPQTLQDGIDQPCLDRLPPLAQWLAWLIVTHHRLPPLTEYHPDKNKESRPNYLHYDLQKYYKSQPTAKEKWVKNDSARSDNDIFWQFSQFIVQNPLWQKQLKRYAQKALHSPYLTQLSAQALAQKQAIADPFLLYLSRLSLMVGDHRYSGLPANSPQRLRQTNHCTTLAANTYYPSGKSKAKTKQTLDEHLLGVARFAGDFVRALPFLHHSLPKLTNHNPLLQNTDKDRFLWQNKAFKAALKHQQSSQTHGFFGVNMASTGTGKTIGNARIMCALSGPKQGSRLTIALGLRVLTLQTGQSLRRDLQLNDNQLAILVGGLAQKQLFELAQSAKDSQDSGSESAQGLFDEFVDAKDSWHSDDLKLGAVIADDNAKKLLLTPVVSCTIDHLIQACECKRGGRYVVPALRLFGSDLILDEPDDFDQDDLPALSRLVHLAGLFGSRVLLSSATLPPDMVIGLFNAYQAGRKIYNAQFNKPDPKTVCAWFDENHSTTCQVDADFASHHTAFIQKRVKFLASQPNKRMGKIMPICIQRAQSESFFEQIAQQILSQAAVLHDHHNTTTTHSVSIGLVRLANIEPLIALVKATQRLGDFCQENFADCQFYVACYHSRQVLLLRNQLENRLDTLLKRQDNTDISAHADIANNIAKHPHKRKHIFMVLATPVAEVGRDHDYDWAIVEPSSMRSVIQLAGRVQRHRHHNVIDTPNIAILQYNIKALKKQANPNSRDIVFTKPGFESAQNKLVTHDMNALLSAWQYQNINAIPRIDKAKELNATGNLADLEQQVMHTLMNNPTLNVVNAYWQDPQTSNRLHVHLSCLTPFRHGEQETEYVINPHPDGTFDVHTYEAIKEDGKHGKTDMGLIHQPISNNNRHVCPWLNARLYDELQNICQHYPELSNTTLLMRFCTLSTPERSDDSRPWFFDEYLGCWQQEK